MKRYFQSMVAASLLLSGCASDNPFLDSVQEAEPGVVKVALADVVSSLTMSNDPSSKIEYTNSRLDIVDIYPN